MKIITVQALAKASSKHFPVLSIINLQMLKALSFQVIFCDISQKLMESTNAFICTCFILLCGIGVFGVFFLHTGRRL
jgi:hypothetical protein